MRWVLLLHSARERGPIFMNGHSGGSCVWRGPDREKQDRHALFSIPGHCRKIVNQTNNPKNDAGKASVFRIQRPRYHQDPNEPREYDGLRFWSYNHAKGEECEAFCLHSCSAWLP
jgi:hypothetical protein